MKITCASCHKKFDNDKYYGICPKCGAFNRINYSEEEDHKRFHEMYDDSDGHSEYGKHEHYHEEYDDAKKHSDVYETSGKVNTTYMDVQDKEKIKKIKKNFSVARIAWIIIVASFMVNFFVQFITMLLNSFR